MANPQVGDILYSSWGYEQTNIDFYQVVRLMKKMIALRPIASKITDTPTGNGMAAFVLPVPDSFKGDELKKRVSDCSDGYSVSINDYSSAWKWNGRELYMSWYG